jgi:hypothetical protein
LFNLLFQFFAGLAKVGPTPFDQHVDKRGSSGLSPCGASDPAISAAKLLICAAGGEPAA